MSLLKKTSRRWWRFGLTASRSIKAVPGCYVLMHGSRVMYVGQSENVRRRLMGYRFENFPDFDRQDYYVMTPWGPWYGCGGEAAGRVFYAKRFGEQLMVEARLIRRLQPEFNRRGLG